MGPLTLDLLRRDARRGPSWLSLHPREFAVLWRLADEPGTLVSRRQLLTDVWRISQEPETNSVEVHVSRLRIVSPRVPEQTTQSERGRSRT
jgi:two-component system OmpR family response regulator